MTLSHRTADRVHHDRATPPAPRARDTTWPVARSPHTPEATEPPQAPVYRVDGLVVDCAIRRASIEGHQLHLTCMEFELIAYLAAYPDRIHTRRRLMELVWQQAPMGDLRTVDVHIARLRRKLGPDHRALIRTVHRSGYALDPQPLSGNRSGNTA
ncbi:winged helix-turn-helix domain-containing protein [Streptomyces diastatochromogenes]|uniref:winged helix-turn-helix domain-containing protein n=1 Tax=Streptomyces diastatochromogenes TaxID=42236 RepID=UPI002F263C05